MHSNAFLPTIIPHSNMKTYVNRSNKIVVATRAQIIHLLAYKKTAFQTVAEHIDYMYHWIANLWHRDVHELFIE